MYLSRSSWTSVPPKTNRGADDVIGLNNYREPVGVILHSMPDFLTYFNNNPVELLEMRRLDDFNLRGYGDIAYNFAIPSNVEGFYCCRGIISKSAANDSPDFNKDYLSILSISGLSEEPTDQLLLNLQECLSYIQSKYPSATEILPFSEIKKGGGTSQPGESLTAILDKNNLTTTSVKHTFLPPAPLPVGGTSVHIFDLIEALAFYGYYHSRNDGIYGPLTQLAVRNLQQDMADVKIYPKNIDGFYGRWTRDCWGQFLKRL